MNKLWPQFTAVPKQVAVVSMHGRFPSLAASVKPSRIRHLALNPNQCIANIRLGWFLLWMLGAFWHHLINYWQISVRFWQSFADSRVNFCQQIFLQHRPLVANTLGAYFSTASDEEKKFNNVVNCSPPAKSPVKVWRTMISGLPRLMPSTSRYRR